MICFSAVSVHSQSIGSCNDFINLWLRGYEHAKTYKGYDCESTSLNGAKFFILGRLGTQSTDQWF